MAAASLSSRSPRSSFALPRGRRVRRTAAKPPLPLRRGVSTASAAHVAAGSEKAFRLAASGPRAFPWGFGTADFQWTANGRLRNQRGRRLFEFQVGVMILSDVMTTWAGGGRRLFRLKKKRKKPPAEKSRWRFCRWLE